MKLTPKETETLKAINTAIGVFCGSEDGHIWSGEILTYSDSGISARSFSGLCGSLAKKGLIASYTQEGDDVIYITPAGRNTLRYLLTL